MYIQITVHNNISLTRNIRELSWMYPFLISIEFSFHFYFLWYSSIVVNSARFFKTKIVLVRHSLNNYQMGLYKLISCVRKFSIKLTLQLSIKLSFLSLEHCKNYYRKENISVDGTKQGRDTLFWIHLRETSLNVFILGVYEILNTHVFNWYKALCSASSSTSRDLDFIRAVWWLCAAYPMVFLKERQLYLHKYVKYLVLYPIIV